MERQYKDSGIEWIGRIPREWNTTAIKQLMYLYAGATPKSDKEDFWDGDIVWITPADYKTEDVFISKGRRNISAKGMESCATTLLPINSIIFSKRAPIGLVVLNSEPLCTNQGCIGCIPKKEKAYSKYYYYALSAFTEQFELYGAGTTFKEISTSNFANFLLPFPQIEEQQRIAEYLDVKCGEIDGLIALQEQMISQLTDYKQSVITESVTKGLNSDVELVPSGIDWIGYVPKGWKVMPLKWLLRSPLQYGANESGVLYDDTLPRYVRITDILNNNLREDLQKLSLTEEQANGYILENNDILFARSGGTVGKTFIFKEKYGRCAFAGYLIRAQIVSACSSEYIYYYTQSQSYDEWKKQIFIQATIQNIGADRYSTLEVPVPPLDEQRAIVSYLDAKCGEIDRLIETKRQKIETLKEYKKSIIYEAVTGKTDLRNS